MVEEPGAGGVRPPRRGLACAGCGQPISGAYYRYQEKTICDPCRLALQQPGRAGGTPVGRFFRAAALGLGAAAIGGALCYGIAAATNSQWGIVAIVVGLLVGGAVRKGSDARGGWGYQLLAMALTWVASSLTYLPWMLEGLREGAKPGVAVNLTSAGPRPADVAKVVRDSAARSASEAEDLVQAGGWVKAGLSRKEADDLAARLRTAGATVELEEREGIDAGSPLVVGCGFVLALLLSLVAPVLGVFAGADGILGVVIVGIALYEAWRLNRRVQVEGPFRAPAPPPAREGA